jgi:hypothetical protein
LLQALRRWRYVLKRFDPAAIKARMLDRMRVNLNWALLSENGTISAILDTFADTLAESARYGEYLLAEKKWTTAQNSSSLVAQAGLVGYKAKRARSAISYIIVSHTDQNGTNRLANYGRTFFDLDAQSNYDNIAKDADPQNVYRTQTLVPWTYPVPYSVPKGTRFIDANGTEFISTSTVASRVLTQPWSLIVNDATQYQNFINAGGWSGVKYLKVPVIQGKVITYNLGTALGARFETMLLPVKNCEEAGNNVSRDFLQVFVNTTPTVAGNAIEWTQVPNILLAGPNDKVFEVINVPDFSGVLFKFGDGITGAKLPAGASVSSNYLETLGASGNEPSKYQITTMVFPPGVSMIDPRTQAVSAFLSCTNSIAILGGSDAETNDDLRISAPMDYLQYYTIATTKAYEAQILNYAQIGLDKVKVFSGYDISNTNTTFVLGQNSQAVSIPTGRPVLYLTAISSDGAIIENAQDQLVVPVSQSIGDLKGPSDTLTYIDPNFIKIKLNAQVYSSDTQESNTDVETAITQALLDKYSVYNVNFGDSFHSSEFSYITKAFPFVNYTDSFIEAVAETHFSSPNTQWLQGLTSGSVSYPTLYQFNFKFDKVFGQNPYLLGFRNYRQSAPYLLRVDLKFLNDPVKAASYNRTFFLYDNRYQWTAAGGVPTINAGLFLDQAGMAVSTNQAPTNWLRPDETLNSFSSRAVRVAQFPYIGQITDDTTMLSKIKPFNQTPTEIRPYIVDSTGAALIYNVSDVVLAAGVVAGSSADPRVILPGGTQCYVKDSRYINFLGITFSEDYEMPDASDYANGSITIPASYFSFTNINVDIPTEFMGALKNYVEIKVYAQPLLQDISPQNWNDIVFVDSEDILVERLIPPTIASTTN